MLNITAQYNGEAITDAMRNGYLEMLREKEAAKQNQYIRAREYYDGIHHTQLTERTRQFLNLAHDADFNANYCPLVVNAKANRLTITGFDSDDKNKEYWRWWKRNRMDKTQGIVHRAAIRDGDAFVLVEWDSVANLPRFHYNPAYAGDGMMVYYSDERREEIEFASKHWRMSLGSKAGTIRRLNLYFADRIEKYISIDGQAGGRWQAYTHDDNAELGAGHLGQAGIHWWTDTGTRDGNPLGVPVVHFKHNDTGDSFGTSHLNSVIPLQDAVNKSLIDLIAAMDVEGFGLLVGLGDNWSGVNVGPGALVHTTTNKTEASLERLPGANPVGLIAAYNALVMEIARVSNTPLSYFQLSGQVAAEGTMKQQEIGLLAEVEKSHTDFGNSWEDCMLIARRLAMAFGDEYSFDEDTMVEAVWKDPTIRNEKEQAETLSIKVTNLGVSEEQAQTELGYNETQRAAFRRAAMQKQAMMIKQQTQMATANGQGEAMKQNMSQTDNENNNEGIEQ